MMIFTILLVSMCFVWELDAYNSNGYPTIVDANRNCWPHDIQVRGGHYFCLTFQQTILNKYAEQFGHEASKLYEDYDKFRELIKFIEDKGFCATQVSYQIRRLYPDYRKYLTVGQKIHQFWRIYGFCAPKIRRFHQKKN